MEDLRAIKVVTQDEYLDLAQNGARVLFDIADFRLLDGIKDEEESYFLINFKTEKRYLIDLYTCYSLLSAYHCGSQTYVLEEIHNIIASVK